MNTATHLDELPTPFGALELAGHVLVAMPTRPQLDILSVALQQAGWTDDELVEFRPLESVQDLAALVGPARMPARGQASAIADLGSEPSQMRRYLQLVRRGHSWLRVKVGDAADAEQVGSLSRLYGAAAAVHYRRSTVDDLT